MKKNAKIEHEAVMDDDPAFRLSQLVRTASDALEICDWLSVHGGICQRIGRKAFHGLREKVAAWDYAEPRQLRAALQKVSAKLCRIADSYSRGEIEICPCFLETFLMFRALNYATQTQCEKLAVQMQ